MKRNIFLLTLICIALASCTERRPEVRNVIYLIGDGMGFGAVSSLLLTDDSTTAFEMAPVIGLSESCSANNYVTDSPAGGTALACGERTLNGYVGVDVNGRPMKSILKKAQEMGKSSGIVVNTVLTEATPADFYASVLSRSESYKIAEHFVESGVDVAIGAGLSAFVERPDSLDLTESLKEKGYDVYTEKKSAFESQSDKFVAILPMEDVHRRNVPDSLAEKRAEAKLYLEQAVEKAISVLENKSKDGFFLMIESAIIDGYGHSNDSDGMVEEMLDFDRTVKKLVNYVNTHDNTLLVVTADHETGGITLGSTTKPDDNLQWALLDSAWKADDCSNTLDYDSNRALNESAYIGWTTTGHTGGPVPVYALGAGAERFGGRYDNTEIMRKILAE